MKVNAICIIKNEADIISEVLDNGLKFCHRIYILDNGSTDGSWELICQKAANEPRIIIAGQTQEIYRNQFRNRVYNMFHQEYSPSDWWYILDADEMLVEDPRPMLVKAMQRNKTQMRVWQAQFYFTEKDLAAYNDEDKSLPVSARRHFYRVNWREPRFFRNSPTQSWSEDISGKVPPFCEKLHHPSPICRHYAERTPEQIQMRRKIRLANPYSFLHVKNKSETDWLKNSKDCFYYKDGGKVKFPLRDRLDFYVNQSKYWVIWRLKNIMSVKTTVMKKISRLV